MRRFIFVLPALIALLIAPSAFAASAPTIEGEWSANVGYTTAEVKAEINPQEAETTYRFEYGTSTTYGASVPIPDEAIGAGAAAVQVTQHLTGIQPGTTYHYRVVATNAEGTTEGADKTVVTYAHEPIDGSSSCPNASLRVRFSAQLPDCRAFEMVSPVEKNGADVAADGAKYFIAAEDGERILYSARTGFGGTHGSSWIGFTQYMAERGTAGWATHSVTPTPSVNTGAQIQAATTWLPEFTPNLDEAALVGYSLPGAPEGGRPEAENLYLENALTGKLTDVVTNTDNEGEPLSLPPLVIALLGKPQLGGASSDLHLVTFMSRFNLVPEAHGFVPKVYAYENGMVKLVGILPDGSVPAAGSELVAHSVQFPFDPGAIEAKDTVSTDGSRIIFQTPQAKEQLFMRENGTQTVEVTESETVTPVVAKKVKLEAASPDLKHIVFSTSTRLLDSAPETGGRSIYLYTDSPNPATESNLTYVGSYTLGTKPVLGMSEDGTHIYYEDGYAVYLWAEGHTEKIAPEPGVAGYYDLNPYGTLGEARVTPDGRELAFTVEAQLTANGEVAEPLPAPYGNHGEHNVEMYLYSEATKKLKCVSCPASGARATIGVEREVTATHTVPTIPLPWQQRFLSSDGRYVFFSTAESLLPQDTNGVMDAYEYDTVTGRLSLLSSGTGEQGAWFVDASADGRNAFIATRQQLVDWDPDTLNDLYDVRVDGGYPEPPIATGACFGEECQEATPATPSFNTANGFHGAGNLVSAASKPKGHGRTGRAKRRRELRRALRSCRHRFRHDRHRRRMCVRRARRRHGGDAARVAGRGHKHNARGARRGGEGR